MSNSLFKPWHLAAIEEAGYGDTNTAIINKVANYLAEYGSRTIENTEFIRACKACAVDPYSFTPKDLDQLQERLEQLT